MTRIQRNIPDSFNEFVSTAFSCFKTAWKQLLTVSVIFWSIFAAITIAWGYSSINFSAFQEAWRTLQVDPNTALTMLGDNLIKNSTLLLVGAVVIPILYIVILSYVSASSASLVEQAWRGKQKLSLQTALRHGLSRTWRMTYVFAILTGTYIVLLLVAGFISFASSALVLSTTEDPSISLIVLILFLPLFMLAATALWLYLYSRWSLSGQAAAVGSTLYNPFTLSNKVTQGRRWQILLRVLAVTITIGIVASILSSVMFFGEIGPVFVITLTLLFRILLSVFSSAVTVSSLTPLYLELEDEDPSISGLLSVPPRIM